MLVEVLKSKIHRVRVTQAELHYVGSITIDEDLLDASGMFEGLKVQIVNINNGERFETYVIKGARGSGQICLNGPAARKVQLGDIIIIIAYTFLAESEARQYVPRIIFPDADNRLI
jgi:aspartate 1-decarboxylase